MTVCMLVLVLSAWAQDEGGGTEPPVQAPPTEDEVPTEQPEVLAEPAPATEETAPGDDFSFSFSSGADAAPPPPSDDGGFSFGGGASEPAANPDKVKIDFGGLFQYDLRFRTQKYPYGTYYNDIPDLPTLARNELMAKVRFSASFKKFGAKADVDFVARAYPKPKNLSDLSEYNTVSPFRFEMHDLYIYGRDLFGAKGLDVRIGQQKAMFGVGDQFNPTNNVNANDLEDVLLFGDQIGNLMVRADYSPLWNLTFTGIAIPVFKPSLVPNSAYLAQSPDRFPFLSAPLRHNLAGEAAFAGAYNDQRGGVDIGTYPTIVGDVNLQLPEFTAKNVQGFARIGWNVGGQDMALSYYNGRSDLPQPVRNVTRQVDNPLCEDPGNPDSLCVDGTLTSDVTLMYPKIQVAGFNMTGEMNPFGKIHKSFKSIGYRIELGVFFPEEVRLEVIQDNIVVNAPIVGPVVKDGEYAYPNGDNRVLSNRPFAKWVVGLDYQFNRYIYMNTQWVHGFPDEFGAGDWTQPKDIRENEGWAVRGSSVDPSRVGPICPVDFVTFAIDGEKCASEWLRPKVGDYLVWGMDLNLLSGSMGVRLFTIWDLVGMYRDEWDDESGQRVRTRYGMFTKEGFSAVIYPAVTYKFGYGLELQGGGLFQIGQPHTKFGAPENGGHQIWMRARFSY